MPDSHTRATREARSDRARIRVLVEQGLTDSAIAKQTGITYAHVKQVAAQERAALAQTEETSP